MPTRFCDKNYPIDKSPIDEILAKQKALESRFNVIHSDNLTRYSENFFDLVVGFDVLEHIPQSNLHIFISEVKRILKKG